MNRYKPYPAYKNSGVEWLGEVPVHWDLTKLKHLASFSGGGTPSRDNPAFWNGKIPWVSPKDMKAELIEVAEEFITDEGLLGSSTSLVPPGRVLMVVRSGILKHTIPVATNKVAVALNQDMKALAFKNRATHRFFLRWVQGLNDELLLAWSKQGATVESIEQAYFAETVVPLPSDTEQVAIATFLDRETTKLDTLIATQEKLIELLQEKRQALISHAVNKGLIPDVPMKDSGVKWVGKVPEHWEIKRLKQLSPQITVGIVVEPSKYYVDKGIPALRSLNIFPGHISLENVVYISPESNQQLSKSILRTGDLVAVRSGQPGTTAIIPVELDGINCIDLIIIRSPENVSSLYLCWFMNSDGSQHQFNEGAGGAIQQHFNIGMAMNIAVPCPPQEEQVKITTFLDRETTKLDTLIAKSRRSIDLMREHRTALISAAVTGKIDVREAT